MGHLQETILALINSDADGGWSVSQICALAYPRAPKIGKKHRVAVSRALRAIALPGTWRAVKINSSVSELCLVNTASPISMVRRQWFSYQMEWHLHRCKSFEEFMRREPGSFVRPVDRNPESKPVYRRPILDRSI
jgi:hypothetical protein